MKNIFSGALFVLFLVAFVKWHTNDGSTADFFGSLLILCLSIGVGCLSIDDEGRGE